MKSIMPFRRHILASAALFACILHPTVGAANSPTPSVKSNADRKAARKRNVIFILVDDLRFDGLGFLQPQVRTPNIDKLAQGGSYFPNTRVTSSLCSPSRATILTGMTTRNHGIVDNNHSSEEGLTFFPSYLQQAGYQTAFVGKWHMGDDTDAPRSGFDKWISFKGQGNYYPTDGLSPQQRAAGRVNQLNVDGREVAQKHYLTDELNAYALNWLAKERDPAKPFFLYLSHKAVHSDPLPALRHVGQYDRVNFKLPASAANTPENYRGKPLWVYNQRNTWHGIDFFYNSNMSMQQYLRYYYSSLSAVDDGVGQILQYLRRSGLEKDTLVVFTSDNGFQIGEHGLIDKRTAYEPSVKVPMVMYQPGTVPAGAINTGRLRNLDIAPTFLDLADVRLPAQFEGRSAWPLITGKVAPADWKADDFVYEYYWEWTFPMTPGTFSIVRDQVKYIQYHGVYDTEELYDLARDPDEMDNLIDDPAWFAQKQTLRKTLHERLANRDGRHVIPYTQRMSRGSVRRNVNGTGASPYPAAWLVEPNRLDRLDDVLPDSPEKEAARAKGVPYRASPVVGAVSKTLVEALDNKLP